MEIVQLALVRPCADWLPATLLELALGKALKGKRYLEVLALKKNDIGLSGLHELEDVL